jgi:hypothetical protein
MIVVITGSIALVILYRAQNVWIDWYNFFAVFIESCCNNVKGVESDFICLIVPSDPIQPGAVFDGMSVKYHPQAVGE